VRKFWWLFALVFVPSIVILAVGSGWITDWSVKGSVNQARRQVQADMVVRDLGKALQGLEAHGNRVKVFSFALPNPDMTAGYRLYEDLSAARRRFYGMAKQGSGDSGASTEFQTAMRALKAYKIHSTTVFSPSQQSFLSVLCVVTGLLALALGLVRFISGE